MDAELPDLEDSTQENTIESNSTQATVASPSPETDASAKDEEVVFLQVDGMHSVTCEAYLKSLATDTLGVSDATASYVTETIRISYDPEQVSTEELRAQLDVLGYAPRLRTTAETTGARRSQRGGPGRRSVDELLGYRYVAGVVFASFLLLPYVALFYPAHLAALNIGLFSGQFAGLAAFSGTELFLVLPLFLGLTGLIVLFTGAPLLRGAYVGMKLRQPNTELLATLTILSAILLSVISAIRGQSSLYFDLAIVVAAGVVGATYYETNTKQRALAALTDRTISAVEEVRLQDDTGEMSVVDRADVPAGARVLVRAGERVPVDGEILDGECLADESFLTGEGQPVPKSAGDTLLGGSLLTTGWAALTARPDGERSRNRLRESVWALQSATHGVHRHANRIATIVAPLALVLGVVGSLYGWRTGGSVLGVVSMGLVVLVVVTPWVLGLASPLSVAAGIEAALKQGIIVFDETVFERLRAMDTVVLDKTGTLTTGEMRVRDVAAPEELVAVAGRLEQRANHPVADAIASAFGRGGTARSQSSQEAHARDGLLGGEIESFTSHALGVEGRVGGSRVLVGHPKLVADAGWDIPEALDERIGAERSRGRVPVVVGRDGAVEGLIVVSDAPRDGWAETVAGLAAAGLEVVVLTGDTEAASNRYREHPAVVSVFAGVSPAGKTAVISRLQQRGRVAMVGDGSNDAPALTQADLGIVLGSGTAIAAEAADVGLLDDDLSAIDAVFELANAMNRRVKQNNVLAFTFNVLLIPLLLVGVLNPLLVMLAVLLTIGLLAANSFRPLS